MSNKSFYDQILAATGKGTPNYSVYAIPVMWALALLPHAVFVVVPSGLKWQNANPRDYLASIARKEKKTASEKFLLRAEAASLNGFENVGWFAAAIALGNLAKLPAEELNSLAGAYLATRILFILTYVFISNEGLSYLRSGAFFAGAGINITLLIRAARALQ